MSSSLEKLERLIDFEIGRIDQKNKDRGWTNWALYAAFCTLIWLILDLASKKELDLKVGALLWALLVLSYDALRNSAAAISGLAGTGSKRPRFVISNSALGPTRIRLVMHILKFTGICALAFLFLPALGEMRSYIFYGYLGALLMAYLVLLIVSFSGLPMPKGPSSSSKNSNIIGLAVTAASATAAVVFWSAISFPYISDPVTAWKSAALFFALTEVTEWIISHQTVSPFLRTLVSLKRDLLLENLSEEKIKSSLEVALHGMKIGDIMAPIVDKFLQNQEQFLQQLRMSADQERRILKIIEDSAEGLTEEAKEMISTRMAALMVHVEACEPLLAEASALIDKISTKVRWCRTVSPGCVEDINAMIKGMLASNAEISKSLEERRSNITRMRTKYAKVAGVGLSTLKKPNDSTAGDRN